MSQQDSPGADDPFNGAGRHPLGVTRSNQTGAQDGAMNLLRKAVRSLRASDTERAMTWIRRALALPSDDSELTRPGVVAAHLLVFQGLVGVLEAAPEGDSQWIDAVRATEARCDADGLADLQLLLRAVVANHGMSPAQQREVRRIRAVGSDSVPTGEMDPDSPGFDVRIRVLLEVGMAFVDEAMNHGDRSTPTGIE